MARMLAVAAVCLSAGVARAQVDTWTSTSSALWGTAGNWSAGVPTATKTATFNSSAGLQTAVTLLAASTTGSLSFASTGGAMAYTFDTAASANTHTLTIASGITNSDLGTVTFYNTTTLAGAQTWSDNGQAMNFDGKVDLGSGPSGFALTIDGSGGVDLAGIVANGGTAAGRLVYSGTGTLTLSGADTYSGGTTVSSGTVNIQNNTALGTAAASVATGATLQLQGGLTNVANALTLNGVGVVAGHPVPIGALESVSGANTISGVVTLGSAAQINSDAGTLSITTGGIAGTNQNLTVGGAGNTTVSGIIATGSGTLTKTGAGTLTLSGLNTFTGATTIDGGALSIGADKNLGTAPALPSSTLSFNGGTLDTTATFALSSDRSITLGASGGTFDVASGTALTYGGIISGAGNLTSSDAGTLILTGANSLTGATTIASGSHLQLGNGTTNGTLAASAIANSGTLLLDENSAVTVGNVISGAGAVTQNGSVNTTLSGANSYSGTTTVNSGTLTAGSTSAFGGATGLSAVTLNNSAVLALGSFNNTVGSIASGSASSSITLGVSPGGSTLTTGGDNASTSFAGVLSGAGGLTEAGTGTLTLLGVSTFTGATTIDSGATLQLGNGAGNGGVMGSIVNNGTLILDENAAGPGSNLISGTGTLIQNATINTTLAGIDTYSGSTIVNSGTLTAGSTSAFGGATGLSAVTVNGSGVLALNGFNNTVGSIASGSATSSLSFGTGALTTGGDNTSTTFAGVISGAGGGNLTKVGAGTLTLTGANTYTGTTAVNGGALSIGADNNLGAAPGAATANMLTLGGGTLDTTASFTLNSDRGITLGAGGGTFVPTAGTTLTYGGVVAGSGALTLAGPGNVTLAGANTYTGATNLNGGTLTIGADNNLGAAPGAATANMLNFAGGGLATTATFTLNANRGMTVSTGGTISVAGGTTLTYGGLIAGTGNLAVSGAGTFNLTNNALNLAGSATVTAGELEFSGSLPSIGTLTLGSGSTLFLNGSNLSVTNLIITGNAIIDFGGSSSILNTTNFTIGAGDSLSVIGWTNEVDYFYTQNWSGVTLGTKGTGAETQVTFSGHSSSVTGWLAFDHEISPAPEPAAYGAILVGICLLGIAAHRRKLGAT